MRKKTVQIKETFIVIDEKILRDDIKSLFDEGLEASANGGNRELLKKFNRMIEIAFQIDETYLLPSTSFSSWVYISDIYVPLKTYKVGLLLCPTSISQLTVRLLDDYCNKDYVNLVDETGTKCLITSPKAGYLYKVYSGDEYIYLGNHYFINKAVNLHSLNIEYGKNLKDINLQKIQPYVTKDVKVIEEKGKYLNE